MAFFIYLKFIKQNVTIQQSPLTKSVGGMYRVEAIQSILYGSTTYTIKTLGYPPSKCLFYFVKYQLWQQNKFCLNQTSIQAVQPIYADFFDYTIYILVGLGYGYYTLLPCEALGSDA